MRTNWVTLGLLAGIVMLGTGASPETVVQAREWQRQGDIAGAAHAGGMDDVAYMAYSKIAQIFPDTRHGRVAARHAREMRAKLLTPQRSPASDDSGSWLEELVDFFLWP